MPSGVKLSVIIPTFNRLQTLVRVLTALEQCDQQKGQVEVIVVSDGSTDGTNAYLQSWSPRYRFQFLVQNHAGAARARNKAVESANGDRILFLGDDIIPGRELLVHHIARSEQYANSEYIGVLGYTSWHRSMKTTPFLHYVNEYGAQFGYSIIPDPENVPFNFFYTSNVSISRNLFLKTGGFDEDFRGAAWEDIEFAYRSAKLGLRIVYDRQATAEHLHPTNVFSFLRRQKIVGEEATIVVEKHPEFHDLLLISYLTERTSWLFNALRIFRIWCSDFIPHLFSPELCKCILEDAYFAGVARKSKNPRINRKARHGCVEIDKAAS